LVPARLKARIGLWEQGMPDYITRSATMKTNEEGDRFPPSPNAQDQLPGRLERLQPAENQ
jgi:hypothetical protein